jgi:peptidoglycan/LPS O-acetylase OafA/YrhL
LTILEKASGGQANASETVAGAPCSYQTYRNTRFFSSLDGLRCLSILAVIWHHTGLPIEGITLTQRGNLGVDLFFVISGFLITTLLLREREDTGRISLQAFFVRRALRIFPLYYAVVALYVVAVSAMERNTDVGRQFFENLPFYLTYTSNWFVALDGRVIFYFAWSLAAEEQFYLVWPTIEKMLRGWRPVVLLAGLLLFRTLVESAVAAGRLPGDNLAIVILLSVSPAILGGVAMAHVLHDRRTFEGVKPLLGFRWASPLLLVALLAGIELDLPRGFIWILMFFLVGSVVIRESNGLSTILKWRPAAHIGTISYGMYLLHMLSFNAVKIVLPAAGLTSPALWFPVTVAAVTLAATISHRYYESAFLRLKDRFRRIPAAKLSVAQAS